MIFCNVSVHPVLFLVLHDKHACLLVRNWKYLSAGWKLTELNTGEWSNQQTAASAAMSWWETPTRREENRRLSHAGTIELMTPPLRRMPRHGLWQETDWKSSLLHYGLCNRFSVSMQSVNKRKSPKQLDDRWTLSRSEYRTNSVPELSLVKGEHFISIQAASDVIDEQTCCCRLEQHTERIRAFDFERPFLSIFAIFIRLECDVSHFFPFFFPWKKLMFVSMQK